MPARVRQQMQFGIMLARVRQRMQFGIILARVRQTTDAVWDHTCAGQTDNGCSLGSCLRGSDNGFFWPCSRFHEASLGVHASQENIPRTKTMTFGPRSFKVSGPTIWNDLPARLTSLSKTLSENCLKHCYLIDDRRNVRNEMA